MCTYGCLHLQGGYVLCTLFYRLIAHFEIINYRTKFPNTFIKQFEPRICGQHARVAAWPRVSGARSSCSPNRTRGAGDGHALDAADRSWWCGAWTLSRTRCPDTWPGDAPVAHFRHVQTQLVQILQTLTTNIQERTNFVHALIDTCTAWHMH